MIFILNRQNEVVGILRNRAGYNNSLPYFDDTLTEDLSTGAETFQFKTILNGEMASNLLVGNYIAFKKDGKFKLFQIMSTEESHEEVIYMTVYCECAGLELINKIFRKRQIISASLRKFLDTVLEDTGWSVGFVEGSVQKTLDLNLEDSSVYATLQNNLPKYEVELEFRVELSNGRIAAKYIDVYGKRGKVTGKRFEFGKDIKGITRKIDSSELFTALIGRGKNGITFKDITLNGVDKPLGQDYVFDQDSFDKYNNNGYHIMGLFNFETESPQELLRETLKKLEKCKEPKVEYTVEVEMLGNLLGRKWDSIHIGDTVAIVDNSFNPPIHLSARVTKLETSKTNSQNDKCTLANFVEVSSNITEELIKIKNDLEGSVNNSISSHFPIGGEDIKNKAIQGKHIYESSITADHIKSGTITTDKLNTEFLKSIRGEFDEIKSKKADFETVNALSEFVEFLKGKSAEFENLLTGNLSAKNILAGGITAESLAAGSVTGDKMATNSITAGSGIISQGAIGDAEINSLSGNKLKFGVIDTSLVQVSSADGVMQIIGNQILANKDGKNRVVLGEYKKVDGSKEYGLLVRAKDGQTIMLDGYGVHNAGLTSDAVKDNVISSDANINGDKLNINSVVRNINEKGTEKISSTTIRVGKSSLDVELSTQKNIINDNQKELSSQKAMISALDDSIKLKVDNQTFKEKIETINKDLSLRAEIISSNGYIFKNGQGTTTLYARAFRGSRDVTEEIDASKFIWTRESLDTEADKIWNKAHSNGSKSIEVSASEINARATFDVEILE